MPIDLIISTVIVIFILSTVGVTIGLWWLSNYSEGFNLISALSIGASVGLVLVAIFLFWIVLGKPIHP